MKWLPAVLITVVSLCGCKSSQTPFNTLAPFGASRVPPPSTSVGATGAYYNRTATPPTTAPAQPNSAPAAGTTGGQGASTFNSSGSSDSWKLAPKTAGTGSSATTPLATSETSAVRPASFAAGAATAAETGQLRLSGMPVNDATGSATGSEPAKFVPSGSAVEISQLPKAIAAPVAAPAVPAPAGTVVASAQASDQAAPAAASPASTLQWKSRP